MTQLLSESDIFVLPSHNEGLPVALLEAMAAGLPVITTPVGAIPDVITHQKTGLLVEPGAVADLSAAIVALLRDNALRRNLGEQARLRVEAHFTVQATANSLAALYEGSTKRARSC